MTCGCSSKIWHCTRSSYENASTRCLTWSTSYRARILLYALRQICHGIIFTNDNRPRPHHLLNNLLDPAKLFFFLLLSVFLLQDSSEAFSFLIAARVFFGTPGSSCSCSILFAQNLELLLHLHMEFPLLPSFWIKLTLNANFSDNSDSQYTVLGKVLTANSFAKANLRMPDHHDWKDSIFSPIGFSASTY